MFVIIIVLKHIWCCQAAQKETFGKHFSCKWNRERCVHGDLAVMPDLAKSPAWAKAVFPQLWQLKAFGARRKNNATIKTRKNAVSKNWQRVSNFFLILQQT